MAERKMIATRGFRYGTRMLKADEEITVSGPRARLYEALGWAKPMEVVRDEPKTPQPKAKRAKRKKSTKK